MEDPTTCRAMVPGISAACTAMDLHGGEASVDAAQTRVLTRALVWVRRGSSNEAVATAISDALPTIHAPRLTDLTLGNPCVLSSMYAICPENLNSVRKVAQSYVRSSTGSTQSHIRLVNMVGPFLWQPRIAVELRQDYQVVQRGWASDPIALSICHALLRRDVLAQVHEWLSAAADSTIQHRIALRIAVLCTLLRLFPSYDTLGVVVRCDTDLGTAFAETVEEMHRLLAPHKAAYVDGMVLMCVELCRMLGPVTFERVHGERRISGESGD